MHERMHVVSCQRRTCILELKESQTVEHANVLRIGQFQHQVQVGKQNSEIQVGKDT